MMRGRARALWPIRDDARTRRERNYRAAQLARRPLAIAPRQPGTAADPRPLRRPGTGRLGDQSHFPGMLQARRSSRWKAPGIAGCCRFDDVDRPALGPHLAHDGIHQPAAAPACHRIEDQQHCLGSVECHRTVTTDSRARNGSHTQSAASRAIAHDRFSVDRVLST